MQLEITFSQDSVLSAKIRLNFMTVNETYIKTTCSSNKSICYILVSLYYPNFISVLAFWSISNQLQAFCVNHYFKAFKKENCLNQSLYDKVCSYGLLKFQYDSVSSTIINHASRHSFKQQTCMVHKILIFLTFCC